MGSKSREEGEIGSESREKGDVPPCFTPLCWVRPSHTALKLPHIPVTAFSQTDLFLV